MNHHWMLPLVIGLGAVIAYGFIKLREKHYERNHYSTPQQRAMYRRAEDRAAKELRGEMPKVDADSGFHSLTD